MSRRKQQPELRQDLGRIQPHQVGEKDHPPPSPRQMIYQFQIFPAVS